MSYQLTHKVWKTSRSWLEARGLQPRVKRRSSNAWGYRWMAIGPFELWHKRDNRPRWRTRLSPTWWLGMRFRIHVIL